MNDKTKLPRTVAIFPNRRHISNDGNFLTLTRAIIATCLASVLALVSLERPAGAVVHDKNSASAPMKFSDGALATAFDHCGDADLCATIAYPNGEQLSIYSEGAAYCQPYVLHFVRVHGTTTIYEFSRTLNHDPVSGGAFGSHCGNNRATQMTLDRGFVHLTVDEYTDGSLRFVFSPVASRNEESAPQANDSH